ncbi:MAG: cytochrome c maturation protein CcmE [Parvularculaceae bacterium]|nr:cytochrome c maturation protein CcmE [Parvularculaceae bacterium]
MKKKSRRIILISAIVLASAASIGLVLTALNRSVSYFFTPSELAAMNTPPVATIRVGGLVKTGSVSYSPDIKTQVKFTIEDATDETEIFYEGVLPDLFREGQGVIVQGRLSDDGHLVASEVLAKHDENYMPKEIADALKKDGRWKEGETPN